MDSFAIELALDRIEAALAAELPAHVRAFAAAYAAGAPAPPAPPVLSDAATLAAAERALADPAHAARGRRLWRQCALLAVANAVPARQGGWPALEALARDREAAAQRRFGRGFLALAHDVFEVGAVELAPREMARVPPIGAPPLTRDALLAAWRELTALPPPTIVVADVHARAFAVAPGEAIVVVRADATVTAWSQALHELGHAWVAIAGLDLPRTLDEAVAIAASLTLERSQPAAARVHARHETIAHALAGTEQALYAESFSIGNREPGMGNREFLPARAEAVPPWALWHDPGAQAAYVAAWQRARAWTFDRLDDLRPLLA
jgi:hypothetical protein